jgi:hypothetical protein
MGKAVFKKAVAKKSTARPKLKALRDGSHGIDGQVYTYKEGDIVTLSKKAHFDSMKDLPCLEEI